MELEPVETAGHDEAASLTCREEEVVALVADGYTQPQIAEQLIVTPETVKSHVSAIRRKLHAHSGREAARLYNAKITPKG